MDFGVELATYTKNLRPDWGLISLMKAAEDTGWRRQGSHSPSANGVYKRRAKRKASRKARKAGR
jgi:hypothetical protein